MERVEEPAAPCAPAPAPCVTPRVSVVIAAYNAEATISAALSSIFAQSEQDFEIILVDDASTDFTCRAAQAISPDPRLRILRMPHNAGPGACRNRGIAAARGTWIAILDADDSFAPTRLQALLQLADQTGADMVSDNLRLGGPGLSGTDMLIPPEALPADRLLDFTSFIAGCHPARKVERYFSFVFMHPMFRRAFLRAHDLRYDEACRNGEDFLLYCDCLRAGARWCVTPLPLYNYRVHNGSLTSTLRRADHGRLVDCTRALAREARAKGDRMLARAAFRHWRTIAPIFYYYSLKDALRARDMRAASHLLQRDWRALGLIAREFSRRAPGLLRKKDLLSWKKEAKNFS